MDERILTKSRAMEYLTLDGLAKMTGVPAGELDIYVLKELVDNALDAAELTNEHPDVLATITLLETALVIEVRDAGAGMSAAMVREITSFDRFGGTKYFVKRPTRGAQGNALMTIVGAVAALWRDRGHDVPPPTVIEARGERHEVRLRLDAVLERADAQVESVRIAGSGASSDLAHGTRIGVRLPLDGREDWGEVARYRRVIEEFALWNPHAGFRFAWVTHCGADESVTFEPTAAVVKRERGGGYGSPHWYTLGDFEKLVFANVRALEQAGEQEPTLEFAKRFRGCTSNRKEFTAALRQGMPRFVNELRDPVVAERLFHALREAAKAPAPAVLGEVGREHLRTFVGRWGLIEPLFKYQKIAALLDGTSIPFVLEVAIGAAERLEERRVAFGINGTVTCRSPFEQDLYQPTRVVERDAPWQRVNGFRELLGSYRIGPQEPVLVAVHLFCPNIRYGDYGKSSFETGGVRDRAFAAAVERVGGVESFLDVVLAASGRVS